MYIRVYIFHTYTIKEVIFIIEIYQQQSIHTEGFKGISNESG